MQNGLSYLIFLDRANSNRRGVWAVFSSPGQSPGRAVALPSPLPSTFTLKIFKSLYFLDHLVHIWYDDKYSSKVLFSNTQAHYLKVKVIDLEMFNVKDF